ncbi:tyrosine-protein phosphatase-like protein non-receptor [Dothidotthia symphoricarpi CBS 119687]|uniref:protein-tyrosine-phosphatase n=1 Tax=Dothidotthia symphoricarpi CBS 119687 TaxID=1392245 RepID=A0A6A6ARI6_9PLEO|nr:tyrosine-protein phosphatase-like protein non-receptor [Dothidotthia symphoricarpi CBS 119687]KAF2133605.1 tyrosine-protein phosphatase-like protein non-receptor [Dothidotthia symphoricarpi CBS 119687]
MSTPAVPSRLRGSSHSTHAATSRPRSTQMTRPSTSIHPTVAPSPFTPLMNAIAKTPSHIAQNNKSPGNASPNYFGLTVNGDGDHFSSSAAQHIRGNWSPPTSNVRSTAAASPQMMPVEQNPAFELFRRQSENNRGFSLGSFEFASGHSATSKGSFFPPVQASPQSPQSTAMPPPPASAKNETKNESSHPPKPRSPKRMLSTESTMFPDRPRRNSPASFEGIKRTNAIAEFVENRDIRASLPPKDTISQLSQSSRSETLPAKIANEHKTDGPTLATPQHIVNILESSSDEILLLDLRVSTQYAKSCITGALSLCIPTTLLKRASFNVEKLAENFKDEEQRQRFERWRSSKHIIVYDASSSQLKDATTCVNTLKKFTGEGWSGGCYIIRGGFNEFAQKFPSRISQQASASPTASAPGSLKLNSNLPLAAPVIGGCPMPATQSAANPFFGNIRQNMDLIGGVGQMSLKHPEDMTESAEDELPQWLQKAAENKDNGKSVSDKFLKIERREQKRMQEALSGTVVYGTPTGQAATKKIQIAGIEKGSKNRYNNIWPYEHSRVKLQGVGDGSCDYVNANHVQATYSNKRYIATQAPIPTTFNEFWNVVWQQDVRVIVMLTAESEGGQQKAHNYWSEKRYGSLHLNTLGERRASLEPSKIHRHRDQSRPSLNQRKSTNAKLANFTKEATTGSPTAEQPYVMVRKFTLSNDAEPFARMREITQLQYSHWPDFGAPAHPTHLLGLIEQTDAVSRQVNGVNSPSKPEPSNTRPIIVHCSAGCGRTGTFCTVDSVLDMLKRQRQARATRESTPMEVDAGNTAKNEHKNVREQGSWVTKDDMDLIEKTVEDFRLQRLSMVQTLRQFVLCYESVMEWLVDQHPETA